MKKRLLSPPQYLNDIDRLTSYPINLMQHQAATGHTLSQKINEIITNSTVTTGMLQAIAELLGVSFKVDCCCLVTVVNGVDFGENVVTWCNEQYRQLPNLDEMLLMEELLMNLPVVQCASEPLTIEDISIIQKSLVAACHNLPLPLKSVLAIPTRFSGHSNGVISLINFQPYQWQEAEKELLKTVESSCAIAFSQVVQAQTIAASQQCLQKANQHQSLIKQLTLLSRTNLELNQMLQLVVSSTAESLEAERGLLILLKYTNPLFRNRLQKQVPKAKANLIGEWHQGEYFAYTDKSFWLSDCELSQRIFTEPGNPVITDETTNRNENWTTASCFDIENFPSTLLMPLENQGKVLGFVVFQQKENRQWQSSELNLVEMVCAQLSNAIIQSQTLRQVQTLVDERTEQLKRSLEVQSKLYERTRQYVEQLQQLNELKDEFVSNISDRLRYPLTNMRMSIRNLRLPGITADRQSRYLDILENECTKEINLINDLLTLQKLESHQEAPQYETIDLNSKIQDYLGSFAEQLINKGLNIAVELPDDSLEIQTETESFHRILQELLTNACKYSESETTITVQVSHRVEEQIDQVMIKVTNTGYGISQEEAAYIFDKFRRGKGRWTPGTGLGLALIKSLVQHLNGAIALESIPIPDSELSEISFILTLPQFSTQNNPYSPQ
ncbi:GAF domain-containing sensor histidine kinase [Cronbergia sp. UHCC 0137]|uniref:sensor histidine kinase n=1 Tax=Cronbergia sp. UHCC 0137 TaxID=3110239 RepID=UPI002B21A8E8|nr:GAF domain-containing sensor histidine kinase [Cronbergia sp. UHCC 0137]MEA5620500.1 GAF domain-containing sensor histidine kinase [Cronbergia sp. UHCC 0137]